jgi:hypothetical protein
MISIKLIKKNKFITILLIATLTISLSTLARRGRGRRVNRRRRSNHSGLQVYNDYGYYSQPRPYNRYYGRNYYDPWLYNPYWGFDINIDLTPDRYDYKEEITEEEIIERVRKSRTALETRINEMKQYLETLEKDLKTNDFKKNKRLLKKHTTIEQDLDDLETDLRSYSGTKLKKYTKRAKNIDKSIKRLRKDINLYKK